VPSLNGGAILPPSLIYLSPHRKGDLPDLSQAGVDMLHNNPTAIHEALVEEFGQTICPLELNPPPSAASVKAMETYIRKWLAQNMPAFREWHKHIPNGTSARKRKTKNNVDKRSTKRRCRSVRWEAVG
jgi:hypothetical protein